MIRIAHVEVDDGTHLRCFSPHDLAIHKGDNCIIKAGKFLDFGSIVDVEELGEALLAEQKMPRVIRCATLQDNAKARENVLLSKLAGETCEKTAQKYDLSIRFVRVRYSFDRDTLMVLFTAPENIDYRDLVKDVSTELRTRIEMRQIGVRDEAGIIGGMGTCGRKLCCGTWLHRFEPINVRHAKIQGLSLNPEVISGQCGRLKCCLRYEYDFYGECDRQLPRHGEQVRCPDGLGTVIGRDIIGQRLTVQLNDRRVMKYNGNEVTSVSGRMVEEDDGDSGEEVDQ